MHDLSIEPATTSDIDSLLKIADECRLARWSRQDFLDELRRDDSIMLIVRKETSTALAFIVGRIVKADLTAEIYNIGVTNDLRRRGIGKALLDKFLAHCKEQGVIRIWLEVRSLNTSAIDFYVKNGFRSGFTRKDFYSDPIDDAILMERNIIDQSAG